MSQQETENTPAKKFTVEPNMPIGKASKMEALLESYKGRITPLLPNVYEDDNESISWEKFVTAIRNAVIDVPDIHKCTQQSIIQAAITACELGLHIGKARGEAYIIPFKNGPLSRQLDQDVYDATLIPGYKGLLRNAYATNQVRLVDAFVVYKQDTFKPPTRTLGVDGYQITFEYSPFIPNDKGEAPTDRDIIGCMYVIVLENKEVLTDFLNIKELTKIRNSSKVPNSPAYRGWISEMYKKGALRRGLKTAKIEDAKFSDTLAAANSEFDFKKEEKEAVIDDSTALQDLTENLLSRAESEEAEDANYVDIEPEPAPRVQDETGNEIDSATGEVLEDEQAEDDGEPSHEDYLAAIKFSATSYFNGDMEKPFELMELIIGSKPPTIDDLQPNYAKKIAQIFNRSHMELNPDQSTPEKVTDFFAWVIGQKPAFTTVRAMVKALSSYRKYLKEKQEEQPEDDGATGRLF